MDSKVQILGKRIMKVEASQYTPIFATKRSAFSTLVDKKGATRTAKTELNIENSDIYRRAQEVKEKMLKPISKTTSDLVTPAVQARNELTVEIIKSLDKIPEPQMLNGEKTSSSEECDKPKTEAKCPHSNRKKICKNMCYTCYHAMGKSKKATKCEHLDKPHYSRGQCQSCYLKTYYSQKKKRLKKEQVQKIKLTVLKS